MNKRRRNKARKRRLAGFDKFLNEMLSGICASTGMSKRNLERPLPERMQSLLEIVSYSRRIEKADALFEVRNKFFEDFMEGINEPTTTE